MTDYLEGALPPLDLRRFEAHLSACPPCLTYLDQMRATVGAVGHVEPETVSPDVLEALVIVFRRYHDGELG
jgi:anti-sigma factor RsiW